MTAFELAPFAKGFALGAGLIVAIGAQNAFILRQGLLGQHVLPLVLFCAISDALLIAAGVAGASAIVQAGSALQVMVTIGGAAVLIWYGVAAWRRSFTVQSLTLAAEARVSLRRALAICATFTWANPHVYLDTVVLVGGFAAALPPAHRPAFGAGAAAASFIWFFALGYGAALLRPLFVQPRTWVLLERAIAAVMFAIAAHLIYGLMPIVAAKA